MAGPEDPGSDASRDCVDDLGATLADLDAAEMEELDALGAALGEVLGGPAPDVVDAVRVGEIWSRIEPRITP